jgi:hypothetical protein
MALELKKKERGRHPMIRSASNLPRRAKPANKRLRTEADPPASKPSLRPGLIVKRRAKQPEESAVVFTVGHSTRTLKEFVALLLAHGVNQLVDVRTIPRSRHNPQFNRDRLPRPLQKVGIRYRHMAGLGGLRHPRRDSINTGWRNASFRGFADYMQTPEFQVALEQLIQLAKKRQTAIMCAEAVPWRCHRSMIGDALLVRGFRVEEIASLTRAHPHTLTPWARVRGKKLSYPADLEDRTVALPATTSSKKFKNAVTET